MLIFDANGMKFLNARFLKSAKNPKNVKNLIGHDPISCQFFVRAYFCGHFGTLCAVVAHI